MSALEEAKARLSLPDLMIQLGLSGHAKRSAKCPFHEDRNNSLSVFERGGEWFWNCFAGCGGGDAASFLAKFEGISNGEACRRFIELAGGSVAVAQPQQMPKTAEVSLRKRPEFPDFEKGSTADFKRLALLRNLSIEGVELASDRGLLWFAELRGFDAWIVSDSERVNAQARRLDGGTWEHLNSNPKAWTLRGSWAGWPIGTKESQPFPALALCEGGPDLLSAFHFAWCEDREREVAPVAMLGASQRIHEGALLLLAGKRIRIFPHLDSAGRQAAERWARQLDGGEVDCFDFSGLKKTNGEAVADLNDCSSICADDFDANRELWEMLP